MTRPPGQAGVIFDCNVYIQAIAFDDGPAAKGFALAESGVFEFFVSKPILGELRRVLTYPEVLAISPNMTSLRLDSFLERIAYRGILLRRVPHVFDFPRDPRDEPYIDLAVASGADFLVTRDHDFFFLMTGHTLLCKQFRQKTRPLRVVDPVQFLQDIGRPWTPKVRRRD